MKNNLQNRITINPSVLNGKPVIRNMRFSVSDMLNLLASGMSRDEILIDYPFLESADIDACILYASKVMNSEIEQLVDS